MSIETRIKKLLAEQTMLPAFFHHQHARRILAAIETEIEIEAHEEETHL